jgi:hypothetical protein
MKLDYHKNYIGRPGVVVYTCNPSYIEDIGRRTMVGSWPQAKTEDPI